MKSFITKGGFIFLVLINALLYEVQATQWSAAIADVPPEPVVVRALQLEEIPRPAELMHLPNAERHGQLFAHLAANSEIEFIISGIRNDIAMDVYLAFSTRPGNPEQPGVGIDPQSLEIVGGVTVHPPFHFYTAPSSLGEAVIRAPTVSVALILKLGNLNIPQLHSNELYFQALAVPAGSLNFAEAQSSEIDHFQIIH